MFQLIAANDPDLLLESLDGLLESLKGGEAITCECNGLPATGADTSLALLKLGNEFVRRMAALGARYRQRGFIVPDSFDEGHGISPLRT